MLVHTLRHHGDITVNMNRSLTFYFSAFTCSYWLHDVTWYRKVPKVTTLVTFGFKSLFLLLLLEGRYFWHLLTPVKFYRFLWRVATFGGSRSLLWELYGTMMKYHYAYVWNVISHVIIRNQNNKTNSLKVQSSSFRLSRRKGYLPIRAYIPPQAWKESAFIAVELRAKPGSICQYGAVIRTVKNSIRKGKGVWSRRGASPEKLCWVMSNIYVKTDVW